MCDIGAVFGDVSRVNGCEIVVTSTAERPAPGLCKINVGGYIKLAALAALLSGVSRAALPFQAKANPCKKVYEPAAKVKPSEQLASPSDTRQLDSRQSLAC